MTTDYVLDELLTLLTARGERRRLRMVREKILDAKWAEIVYVEPEDFLAAWNIHSEFSDKQWSFTDCVSRVMIQRLEIRSAFSFDVHFRQFGIVTVAP